MIMTRTQAPSTLGCIAQHERLLSTGQFGLGIVLRMWHSIVHSGSLGLSALGGRNGHSAAAYGYQSLSISALRRDLRVSDLRIDDSREATLHEANIIEANFVDADALSDGLNLVDFVPFMGTDGNPGGKGNRRCWSHRWRNRVT